MDKTKFWAVLLLLPISAFASYISETVAVSKGWNAVYIESTPESPNAAAFFADLAVTKASCYLSSVYSATASDFSEPDMADCATPKR